MLRRRTLLLTAPTFLSAAQPPTDPPKQTFTYKQAGPLNLELDLYRPAGSRPRPVILWIHGGALIMGNRSGIRPWQLRRYLDAGYAVVSIDYRLAPETKLPGILSDVEDAWKWVHTQGSKHGLDTKRVAVVGHSAGGYLTLTTGFRCRPRPKALVAFYGYGEIAADWYAKPDPFYLKEPAVTEQEARAAVGATPISGTTGPNQRRKFYLWCRQQGRWNQEVAGLDPATQDKQFAPYSPARNTARNFPPTLLLHGDADTDVPYGQSEEMDRLLQRESVPHQLITIPNGPHGFDSRPESPGAAEAFAKVLVFLKRYLG
ncbi:MAG: alpha/beta hydrolase [Bryobacterales bacterium]|nr:alpha/beta hydrolase [Bryobacterales bacterium]